MSAGSGFTPSSACPYEPRMTRAQAIALRTAGGLRENCVVVITDGPVIGTAGNTSPTEIELNPVSPTELGLSARVHTTFDNSAWDGVYDIDFGVAGSITRLTDRVGNTVVDVDADAPTVHTQFPWHLISASTFRDNYIEDCTLPGWAGAVGSVINNRIVGSTVDFTGKTAGTITNNEITSCSIVAGAGGGAVNLFRNKITASASATAAILHTGAGNFSMTETNLRGNFMVEQTGAGSLTLNQCDLSGGSSGVPSIRHAGNAAASATNTVMYGIGNQVLDIQAGVAGVVTLIQSRIRKLTPTLGTILMAGNTVGALTISHCDISGTNITIGAANAAPNNFSNVNLRGGLFSLLGPSTGRNDFTLGANMEGLTVNVAAGATAGVGVEGGWYSRSTINQNRNAGAQSTNFTDCDIRASTITDNGAADPGTAVVGMNRLRMVDSSIILNSLSARTALAAVQQCELVGSTLTASGLAGTDFLFRVRLAGASLDNAGFHAEDLIIDGAFTKVLTAANLNRLCNKAFDDVV